MTTSAPVRKVYDIPVEQPSRKEPERKPLTLPEPEKIPIPFKTPERVAG